MKMLAAVLGLAMALPCLGDEIVMKDGRRIPWKSISDDGENYQIETRDGKRLSVKKADVDHFNAPSDEPIAAPLTGAVIEPKKSSGPAQPIDILLKAKISPDGGWKYMGRVLIGTAKAPARAVVVFDTDTLPDEYDLA